MNRSIEELILGQVICLETLNQKLLNSISNENLKFKIVQPIITEIRANAQTISILLNGM